MKKLVVIVIVCFVIFCGLGLFMMSQISPSSIEVGYSISLGESYNIENTQLKFEPLVYKDVEYNILAYKDSDIDKTKDGSISSFIVGKNCISITGTVLDVNNNVNKKIMIDVVEKLQKELNGKNSEIVYSNDKVDMPYIISKSDKNTFIDIVSATKQSNTNIVYYRIIIQNVRDLETEITDDEYNALSDYLPELLKVLKISEEDLG